MSDDTTTSADSGGQTKQSSALLNILILLLGLFFLSKGVLEFLTWAKLIPLPQWLQKIEKALSRTDLQEALSFFGTQGIVSAALGFWAFIAGILLFMEQESGWGMALVILSMMVIMGLSSALAWIFNPSSFQVTYWPNWITILAMVIGLFGFLYLLITRKRYQ
jgi:hypothetical protein